MTAVSERVAFLGLGVMGFPMAGHLARAGHSLTVFNRTGEKAERWVAQYGGRSAATAAEAVREAVFVFACLGDDPDLREVMSGPSGALAAMEPGSCLVDHTTASARIARELHAEAAQREVAFLDAPVSGGQAGAENGALTVMIGGDPPAFERVQPLISCYARTQRLLGPSGSGQLAKMVNQICIAGVVEGLAEGLHFALAAGLDAQAVIDVISQGAAQSWQMDNRHATMLAGEYDHGFAVEWMRKDLRIALDEARNNGAQLPVAALIDQLYSEVEALGGSRWDTSSLLARLEALRKR
jgi:3-hydroxyisobutyrate dehydrogenase-like beta-hydroxyacid dehydrogenase